MRFIASRGRADVRARNLWSDRHSLGRSRDRPWSAPKVRQALQMRCGTIGTVLVQAQGLSLVADQLDHWHSLRDGGGWLGQLQEQARVTLLNAEAVEATQARSARRGENQSGATARCRAAWAKAERAMDAWQEGERHWQAVKIGRAHV